MIQVIKNDIKVPYLYHKVANMKNLGKHEIFLPNGGWLTAHGSGLSFEQKYFSSSSRFQKIYIKIYVNIDFATILGPIFQIKNIFLNTFGKVWQF